MKSAKIVATCKDIVNVVVKDVFHIKTEIGLTLAGSHVSQPELEYNTGYTNMMMNGKPEANKIL